MTLFILYVLFYNFNYGWGWYVLGGILYLPRVIKTLMED